MTRRALLVLAGLLTTLSAVLLPATATANPVGSASGTPTTASGGTVNPAAETPGPAILIGTGGITWSDVSQKGTPSLWSFLTDGATAALSVRSVFTNTCPVDGWLSLSAGNRAAAPGP
ncbi:MAG TPA: hypothetical protein VFX70_15795, partial [Mycobacteriales bacterium]|nr:hypothetical protein [Mycobacteriales bacterium]